MGKVDKLKGARRFGARYGARVKHKFAKIEAEQRKTHKCPYCHYVKVRRISTGVWNCKKCGALFTGKAYTPGTSQHIKPKEKQ